MTRARIMESLQQGGEIRYRFSYTTGTTISLWTPGMKFDVGIRRSQYEKLMQEGVIERVNEEVDKPSTGVTIVAYRLKEGANV